MSLRNKLFYLFCLATCLTAPIYSSEIIENATWQGNKTTIKYAMWGGEQEVRYSRDFCRRFVELHPDIRVDVGVYPWGHYWAKLQTQSAAGIAPDVISLYNEAIGVWIDRGALLPLNELVQKSGLDLNDYHQVAIDICEWDGTLYALPLELPNRILIYSKDLLEASGIPREEWPRPDEAMDYEDFKALLRRLTLREPDGTFKQYGMAANFMYFKVMSDMYGTSFVDRQVNPTKAIVAGNEPLIRALIEIFQLQYADRIMLGDVPLRTGAVASLGSFLLSKKFAFEIDGPWSLQYLEKDNFRYGLTLMPRTDHPSQRVGVNSAAIFRHSKNIDAAWKLVQFLASEEVQPVYGRYMKGVPALKSASGAMQNNIYNAVDTEAFANDLEFAKPEIATSNNYIVSTITKWRDSLESVLMAEYDKRYQALPRPGGILQEETYQVFVEEMKRFVEQEVRRRILTLQKDLDAAFARAERQPPSFATRVIAPAIVLVLIVLFVLGYFAWIRKNSSSLNAPAARISNRAGFTCISPWIVGFSCFIIGPILAALFLSFTEYNMIAPPKWVGMRNYFDLWGDRLFRIGLERTLSYAGLVIPISLIGGLTTAGLLTCNIRGAHFFKAVFYFPSLLTGAATAVLWVNMFNREYGIVNRIIGLIGIPPVNWMDEQHAFFTVILMNVFWVGGAMIIYYAGMKQIPQDIYEAADIDGANFARKFTHITIPLLSPVIFFMVVMTTIQAFQIFTPALFFARRPITIGEPGDSLRFYSVNIYDMAFNNLRMGRACAYAIILFLIIFMVTMVQMRLSRRWVHREDA